MTACALIIRELLVIEAELEKLEKMKAAAWARFFAVADKAAGKDQSYRYLDPELLQVIARIVPAPQELLDRDGLFDELTAAQRRIITRPVIDLALLDAAVLIGKVQPELVANFTTMKPSAPRRYGPKPATKEERAA
jgi:hypothetical protein